MSIYAPALGMILFIAALAWVVSVLTRQAVSS